MLARTYTFLCKTYWAKQKRHRSKFFESLIGSVVTLALLVLAQTFCLAAHAQTSTASKTTTPTNSLTNSSTTTPAKAAPSITAQQQPLRIYLDADQTNSASSGQAIALGIRAALSEVDWQLGGQTVELVIKDHHGSTPRSRYHIEQFVADHQGLAIFGGLHSPPLISARDYINEQQALTLVPWAAATPITRARDQHNWIFRLSLDDSKAGAVIVQDTIENTDCQLPYLLLEDTGWGKANQKTMTSALNSLAKAALGTRLFPWGLGQHEARAILESAINQGADCFILVANAPEGLSFAKAMLEITPEKRRPIRSHWGITGGNFAQSLGPNALKALDLRFIQSRFSFFKTPLSAQAQQALQSAAKVLNKTELSAEQLSAPAGFIHAYDLTRLLIAAAEKGLTGDARTDRQRIKAELENLDRPVTGLIKRYHKPFSSYHAENFNAHEALNQADFVMAQYDEYGHIHLVH